MLRRDWPSIQGLREDRSAWIAPVGDRAYQFVQVPVRAPAVIGHIVMGFELNASILEDLAAVAAVQARFLGPMEPVLEQSDAKGVVMLDGATALGQVIAVGNGPQGPVRLLIQANLSTALEAYKILLLVLGGLTLVGAALFAAGNHWSAKRITRPLRALAQASERLGQGDYATPVQQSADAQTAQDEVTDLTQAFESMRQRIATSQAEIRQLAYWDRLTGMPNRAQLSQRMDLLLAQGTSLGVVMLDLDRFKHANDVLGFNNGDRLLKAVGERLQRLVGPSTLAARLGGDEFAILVLSDVPVNEACLALAELIHQSLTEPFSLDDQRVDLGASIGLAWSPEHGQAVDELLGRAEVAMYAAKRSSEGFRAYQPAMDAGSAQTLSLLGDLRQALEQQHLRLFLQPKMRVSNGALCGAEGLVRWQHPERGLIPPMAFIPFAEQTGFIRHLTLWVFEQAAIWQPRLRPLGVERLSINLSTRDLMDSALPEKLQRVLHTHRALAEGFCLEITESAIMDEPERAMATLNQLATMGFKLSIDDFGTGYSSLAYLKQLPVKELKIDKSFVMALTSNDGDFKIVRSTIDLAHGLGLSVVAEGVENAEILDALMGLGCDEAQGYHLGKPMPIDTFMLRYSQQIGATAA
jgi:diguanylate cyclase (GGDEF)-like protein